MNENNQNNLEWEEVKPLDFWDEHSEIEGALTDKEPKVSGDGREFWKYSVLQLNGEEVQFNGGKVLDVRLKNCELGTHIKINYLGWSLSANGNNYRDFKVYKSKNSKNENELKILESEATHRYPPDENGNIQIDLPEEREEINIKDIPF